MSIQKKEIIIAYANKKDLYKNQIKRWIDRKHKAISYLGGRCSSCGYDKFYGALEFHHKNPLEKDHEWGKLRLKSWDKVLAELDKCVLLCANCHREEHHLIQQSK